jgi:hypothetical protein
MRNPAYLSHSRHGIFYLRFPMPRSLHPRSRASWVRVSLRCYDPRVALDLARRVSYAAGVLCEEGMRKGMRYEEIREVLRSYFAEALASHKSTVLDSGGRLSPLSKHVFNADVERIDRMLSTGRKPSETEEVLDWAVLSEILSTAGVGELNNELKGRVRDEYQRASRSYSKAVLEFDRSLDDYNLEPPRNEPTKPPVQRVKSDLTLTVLARQFIDFNSKQGVWGDSTAKERGRQFDLLVDILGTDRLAENVSTDDAINVRDTLLALPSNRNKKQATKGLTLADQVAQSDAPRMQQRTITKHLQAYDGLFAWAAQERRVKANPFDGIKILRNAKTLEGTEKAAFTEDQLHRILRVLVQNPDQFISKDHQKWGSLIAAYSGARLNEVCQLHVADIMLGEAVESETCSTASNQRSAQIDLACRSGRPPGCEGTYPRCHRSLGFLPVHQPRRRCRAHSH